MKPNEKITDVEMAFPADVTRLLPPWEELPEDYQRDRAPTCKVVDQWFSCGLGNLNAVPKEGIDTTHALRHLKCIMGSYQPKHEHKTAGVAYLIDLWFETFESPPKDSDETD